MKRKPPTVSDAEFRSPCTTLETVLESAPPNFDPATKKAVDAALKTLNDRIKMRSVENAELRLRVRVMRTLEKARMIEKATKGGN